MSATMIIFLSLKELNQEKQVVFLINPCNVINPELAGFTRKDRRL